MSCHQIDGDRVREFAAGCVGKKSTMVKHNAPDLYVLGISAACHSPAAFTAMEPVLWFEYVRRALGKSDVPQRFGGHALQGDGVSYLPRLTPTEFADQAAPFILQANRFVAALRALNAVADDVVADAPATQATLATLAKAFNDEPVRDTFALAPGVSAKDQEAHSDADAEAATTTADESKASGGSASRGHLRGVVVADPFGRGPEEVLASAAVAAVMVEQRWRRTDTKPLDNAGEMVSAGDQGVASGCASGALTFPLHAVSRPALAVGCSGRVRPCLAAARRCWTSPRRPVRSGPCCCEPAPPRWRAWAGCLPVT